MKFIHRIIKTILSLSAGFLRFPVSLLLAYVMTGVLLVLNSNYILDNLARDTLVRISLTCGMGIPLFLGIKLAFERKSVSIAVKGAVLIVSGLALVGYGIYMIPDFQMVPLTRYSLLAGALVLCFITVPFFFRRQGFALYATKLMIKLLITVLYSGILMLSLFAILFTLDKLLGVNITDKSYVYTSILVWAAFAPTFFIAAIPPVEEEPALSNSPLTLRFLLIYILVPLITVYALILYAYSARILINMAWPEGLVSTLVLSFVTVGILVMFLVIPVKSGNRIAEIFTDWYPRAALPLFIILFAALGVRLNEYGFTEPRYFAFILALWCFGVMVYYTFVKRKYLTVLPVSLALVAILSVFGPISAYSVSEYSQEKRFDAILARNGMLKEDHVVPAANVIPEADKSDLISVMQYFERYHKLSMLGSLPEDFTPDKAVTVLGFDYNSSASGPSEMNYAAYYIDDNALSLPISGYDYMLPLRNNSAGIVQPGNLAVNCNLENLALDIYVNQQKVYSKDYQEVLKSLYNKYPSGDRQALPADELTFDSASGSMDVRVILTSIEGNLPGNLSEQMQSGFVDGYVLLKMK
jgi:hypothetical protein